MSLKKFLITLSSLVFLSTPTFAEQASSESVRDLMIKTGAGDMGMQMINQMLPALRQMVPDANDEFWKAFMSKIDGDQIIDMTIPVYQKYLSQTDIDSINAFYDSPAGKRLIAVQPNILRESMAIGQTWGQQIAGEAMQEFAAQK